MSDSTIATDNTHTPIMLFIVHDEIKDKNSIEFACAFANAHHCRIQLLYAIESSNFDHWLSVGKIMHHESREKAEQIMTNYSILVQEKVGRLPLISILETPLSEGIHDVLKENPQIMTIFVPPAPENAKPDQYMSSFMQISDAVDIPIMLLPNTPKELVTQTYIEEE